MHTPHVLYIHCTFDGLNTTGINFVSPGNSSLLSQPGSNMKGLSAATGTLGLIEAEPDEDSSVQG